MPDSPRLTELRRQRQLLQEHATWLEREIAREEAAGAPVPALPSQSEPPGSSLPHTPPSVPAVVAVSVSDAADTNVDAMLDEYRKPTSDLQRDVRVGCFLYFAAALLILGAVVTVLYFALRH